jgi:hypothetical protein
MTRVSTPSRNDLLSRRAAIFRMLGLTEEEWAAKVASGSLVGDEWAASAEIEEIEYLLEGA